MFAIIILFLIQKQEDNANLKVQKAEDIIEICKTPWNTNSILIKAKTFASPSGSFKLIKSSLTYHKRDLCIQMLYACNGIILIYTCSAICLHQKTGERTFATMHLSKI